MLCDLSWLGPLADIETRAQIDHMIKIRSLLCQEGRFLYIVRNLWWWLILWVAGLLLSSLGTKIRRVHCSFLDLASLNTAATTNNEADVHACLRTCVVDSTASLRRHRRVVFVARSGQPRSWYHPIRSMFGLLFFVKFFNRIWSENKYKNSMSYLVKIWIRTIYP